MGMFQKVGFEIFSFCVFYVVYNFWNELDDSVQQGDGCDFIVGQNVIVDVDFFEVVCVDYVLIDFFEMVVD